jgi:SAM-dependent methyltransferase
MKNSEDQFYSYIDEFIHFRDIAYIKGWAFHAELSIVEVGYIDNNNEHHTVPWKGLPSPDVEEVFGLKAKNCRFDLSFKIKEDDVLDLILVFKLSDGTFFKKGRLYEDGLRRGPWPYGEWERSGVINEFLDILKNSRKDAKILEIGSRARSGILNRTWVVPDTMEYTGLDILDGEGVDVVGDAHQLTSYFPPDTFDFIFSMNVFEHLIMPWKVALEMNHVLRKNGIIMIVTHQAFPLHDTPWDFWRYSDTAWHGLFNKYTGFEILKTELGDPVKILASSIYEGTLKLHHSPAFVHSLVIAKKTKNTKLKWDIKTERILNAFYPE